MRRRHLLALAILALVVATVLAMGPVRVWDWMTTKTVTKYYEDGTPSDRYRARLWSGAMVGGLETWDGESFRLHWWFTPDGTLYAVEYSSAGLHVRLKSRMTSEWRIQKQILYFNERIETRTAPPWFTEEEILQSVEGVEE